MSATKQEIREWLNQGKAIGATHVIIALDQFDYNNYPVYVRGKDVNDEVKRIQAGSMQSVDEVYSLSVDIEEQLAAPHVWNVTMEQLAYLKCPNCLEKTFDRKGRFCIKCEYDQVHDPNYQGKQHE